MYNSCWFFFTFFPVRKTIVKNIFCLNYDFFFTSFASFIFSKSSHQLFSTVFCYTLVLNITLFLALLPRFAVRLLHNRTYKLSVLIVSEWLCVYVWMYACVKSVKLSFCLVLRWIWKEINSLLCLFFFVLLSVCVWFEFSALLLSFPFYCIFQFCV